jgi:hypothetical protein
VGISWSIPIEEVLLSSGDGNILIENEEDLFQLSAEDTLWVSMNQKKFKLEPSELTSWLKARNLEVFQDYLIKELFVVNIQALKFVEEKDLRGWPFGNPSKKFLLSEIKKM